MSPHAAKIKQEDTPMTQGSSKIYSQGFHAMEWGVAILLIFGLLIGCGSGGSSHSTGNEDENNPDTTSYKTMLLDATSGGLGASPDDPKNKYTYFNLSAGEVVDLGDEDAPQSSDWDIAFRRSKIKLNGGLSGAKSMAGYFTGNNEEAYDADGKPIRQWFETATAGSELQDFTSITATDIPADPDFIADNLVPAIKGDGTEKGWWLYDPTTHVVSANPANWWLVRSADGNSYAKFHITELLRDSVAGIRWITIEITVQPVGAAEFSGALSSHTFAIPLSGGMKHFDFDIQAEVDPSIDPGWDMQIEYESAERVYRITLNGGVSGSGKAAAFGPTTTPEDYASGEDVLSFLFFQDSTGGIFVNSPWYAYDITGSDNKLWPNYRVYLIKSGVDTYKLQILSYYHPETAESGWYTIRYEKMEP